METNIGKDCGKTYFGVDFETLSRKFDRDITEKENREKLWSFSFQSDEIEKKIMQLRRSPQGADWIQKKLNAIRQTAICPQPIIERVSEMAKSRRNALATQRMATEQEIEDLEAREGRQIRRPHYVDEIFAEIAGIEALYPENDLRSLLIFELSEKLKSFRECDIDSLTYEQLRYWVDWVNSIDRKIDQVTTILTHGRTFLNVENLKAFEKILSKRDDVSLFRDFMKNLATSNT